MGKKMIAIVGVIVVLMIALFFVVQYQNNQALADNPYGTNDLDQATIDQLDDPNYGNQILPDELSEKLEKGEEEVTVYFYSPTCIYCQNTTPYLVPLAEDNGIDMKKYNLLEFAQESPYAIESTPTLVHFENGEEVARIAGQRPEEEFQAFFDEYVLD